MKEKTTRGCFVWENNSKRNVLFIPDKKGKFRLHTNGIAKLGNQEITDEFQLKSER